MVKVNQGKKIVILFVIFTAGALAVKAQQKIGGRVTDARSDEALPGVNIRVKGTTTGISTDAQGKYELTVESLQDTLVFSFVGYRTRQVPINGRTEINVKMQSQIITGQEMVVVGYGSQRKRDLTGSITSVNADEFVAGVNENPLGLIEGKMAGVRVDQTNAEPGGGFSVHVRGAGSINSSNQVLYVVDGMPVSDPGFINPNDIQSIDVLKDASAAAIYGTRAANGVVLINTKTGQKGQIEVGYNAYVGYQTPANKLDVLNTSHYMRMRNYYSEQNGEAKPFTESEITSATGTDWQDELLRNALVTDHQLSVSGGSDDSRFYTSLGYLNQNGIIVSSGDKKYNASVNYQASPSDRFTFGLKLNGVYENKDIVTNRSVKQNEFQDPLGAAVQYNPTIQAIKDKDGDYQRDPVIALDNPIAMAYGYDDRDKHTGLVGNVSGEYQILSNLSAKVHMGMDISNRQYDSYKDRTTQLGLGSGGIAEKDSYNNNYWIAEGTLNYEKEFRGNQQINVLGGISYEKFINTYQTASASSFLSDITKTNLLQSGDRDTYGISSSKSTHKLQSFFGRVNYNYKDKYLLTGSVRADGSSRFSEKHKYGIFPSVALGWRISEESFMNGLSSIISNLKLRVSYGQLGNEGINNFETIQTFVAGYSALLGESLKTGTYPARIPNPNLKWERTEEYNFGLDFGFLQSRISGSLEYYVRNTKDQLFEKPLPMSTGFGSIRTNFGNVQNSGIDLSITSTNTLQPINWKTSFTFSALHNEVEKLPPFVGDIITSGVLNNGTGNAYNYTLVKEGYPMRAYYGYKIKGIFQQGDNIANSAQPDANPGEPVFFDANNDGKITPDDRVVLGSPFPDYTLGINNSLSYKNINLSIYVTGRFGVQTLNGNVVQSLLPINSHRNIISKYYLDRWTPDHTDTDIPSGINPSAYFGNGRIINSLTVQDASFIRLKTLRLGYQLNASKSSIFRSAIIYIVGDNLLTITNFEGFDPVGNQGSSSEASNIAKTSYNNYPVARSYRLGINIEF